MKAVFKWLIAWHVLFISLIIISIFFSFMFGSFNIGLILLISFLGSLGIIFIVFVLAHQ